MREGIIFKNSEERSKAELILQKYCPEIFYVAIRNDGDLVPREEKIYLSGWEIYRDIRQVYFKKKRFHISDKEYNILEFLADNNDGAFTTEEIAEALTYSVEDVKQKIQDLIIRMQSYSNVPMIQKKEEMYYFSMDI